MQTGKQRKPQEMKGKRGDVADRHADRKWRVLCVPMLEHHALLFFLTRAGHRQHRLVCGCVCVGGGVHMNAQSHTLAESQSFFLHQLCVSLAVCQSNQSESDCGIVGFFGSFQYCLVHMNTSRIIQSKHTFYNFLLKLYFLSLSLCFMDF